MDPELIDEIQLDRELASRSFREYLELAFPHVEPGVDFLPNWHIDAICDHMQAVQEGHIKKLVINVPPGSMKSLAVCVKWPTWCWTRDPGRRQIFGSFSDKVTKRDSRKARQLIESPWYQARWGEAAEEEWRKVVRDKESWNQSLFSNTSAGFRMATTVAGGITGFHGHDLITDDPINPNELTALALEKADHWWFKVASTRKLKGASQTIIMQRLHELDVAGVAIEQGYDCLIIPMEYERGPRTKTPLKFEDPRTEEGEHLWPARWSAEELDTLKRVELGPRRSAAELQQRPAPAEGAIFKHSYVQYYKEAPALRRMNLLMSIDANFKATDNGSYAVVQVWGQIDADCYLLDQYRSRASFSELLQAIRRMAVKWPTASPIIIEDKANGPAIISVLNKELSGVIPCEPHGDKVQRASAVEPTWAAGNVWLPDQSIAPWINDFVAELTSFPVAKNDDQVDAMSQALSRMKRRNMDKFKKAMQNAGKRR